jgi:Ala-tRNA(Pro) deacylase
MQVFDKIKALLDSNNIKYEVMNHEPTFTSEQSARARGTEMKQGAKALVMKTDDAYIMAVLSAAKKVDSAKLREVANTTNLHFVDKDKVFELTGCKVGAVPPFGNLFGLKVFVDISLGENEIIAFNAGSNSRSIKMRYEDYIKLVLPKAADFGE